LAGGALLAALDSIAALRIATFRDFPYLYAGDGESERDYLSVYHDNPHAFVLGAFAGDRMIGAATAMPMAEHLKQLSAPFVSRGLDIDTIFYFGESMVLPEWRGRGIGRLFFERREQRSRELDLPIASFCSVVRPDNHPARPPGYRSLHDFWRARGYAPVDGLTTEFSWKEIGQPDEIPHEMLFWVKHLSNDANGKKTGRS